MREFDECPSCGLRYDDFRMGESFASVKVAMYVDSEDETTWRYRTRRMVLGCWHAMKVALFRSHVAECEHWREIERSEPRGMLSVGEPFTFAVNSCSGEMWT